MVHIPSCPLCTGYRPFCIHKSYPFPRAKEFEKQVQEKLKKDLFGPSYSVFVGRQGYPQVFAGPFIGVEEKEGMDSPKAWFGMDYAKIIELRSFLLRSKKPESIFSKSRFVQDMQELALASRPADVEVSFKRTPIYSLRLSEALQPMGPSGELEKMKVTENVKVSHQIEKVVTDDLTAAQQVFSLDRAGMDVYRIISVFASGALGEQQAKKLVPSRWSTTAIDDLIAKALMENIKTYPQLSSFQVFESQYMDNHFVTLLMPGNWEFENFEAWAPGSNWSKQTQAKIIEEYEPNQGRIRYAERQAGGYYASRISAVRYLEKIQRQARVVVFREVYESYTIPLGVWVVRETSARAFDNGLSFSSRQEALQHIRSRLRLPLEHYIKESKILRQKRLGDF